MTTATQKEPRDDMSDRLITVAMDMIVEHGNLKFSLRELAAAANTTTMSIYSHFGNREGFFRALSTRAFEIFADALFDVLENSRDVDSVEKLRRMARTYRQFALEHPSAYDLLFGGVVSFETVKPLAQQFEGLPSPSENGYKVYGLFASVFEDGVRQGCFRADVSQRLLRDTYWSQIHGLVGLERIGYVRSDEDADERFAFGLNTILDGFSFK